MLGSLLGILIITVFLLLGIGAVGAILFGGPQK